jgi:hypothetical protein
MSDRLCSARPAALTAYAHEAAAIADALRRELSIFDADVPGSDPLWNVASMLADLASWTGEVGWAFAIAGGGPDAPEMRAAVSVPVAQVNGWLNNEQWTPTGKLGVGDPSAWALAAFGASCTAYANGGYAGKAGFIIGPDGKQYPLVAPWVQRGDERFQADDGLAPGAPSVLDLDGHDPGWTTVFERIGVERWRDDPGFWGRALTAAGSTAVGPPTGSAEQDVQRLVLAPGMAPTFIAVGAPAPPIPPGPAQTNAPVEYSNQDAANAAVVGVDFLAGAVNADAGSYDAYDVMFQTNTDGRTRALYRRVFVGYDDSGEPYTTSVWITGPERNDQVPITYAP